MNKLAREKFEERMKRRLQTEWVNYNNNGKYPHISLYPTVGRIKWYFVIYALEHEDYKGGIYLGKITITDEYPTKSPEYTFLTPNAYFAIKEPIVLNEQEWQRSHCNFVNGLLYLKSLMLSLDSEKMTIHYKSTKTQRQWYAKYSIKYNKQHFSPEFAQCFPEIRLHQR